MDTTRYSSTDMPHYEDILEVGAGEYVVADEPKVLVAPALGSCVGLALWDPVKRRGGMAHIMLPAPVDGMTTSSVLERFASCAVPTLVDALVAAGSLRSRLVAKLAGGAAMFGGDAGVGGIGGRNVSEVKYQLGLLRIPILAEDVGGAHARTVELHLDSGIVIVRSYAFGMKQL